MKKTKIKVVERKREMLRFSRLRWLGKLKGMQQVVRLVEFEYTSCWILIHVNSSCQRNLQSRSSSKAQIISYIGFCILIWRLRFSMLTVLGLFFPGLVLFVLGHSDGPIQRYLKNRKLIQDLDY